MVEKAMSAEASTGLESYQSMIHGAPKVGFKKVRFVASERHRGLAVLLGSGLTFRFVGDGYIVSVAHRQLLDESGVEYQYS